MKKFFVLSCLLVVLVCGLFAQSNTNVTNNNSIIINGDVYYFRPSTQKSSPLPTSSYTGARLNNATWYGEDAAKAWASIANWVIEHATHHVGMYRNDGYKYYITQVAVENAGQYQSYHQTCTVRYWIVKDGSSYDSGRLDYVQFGW
ncbi:hypothetical protein AGMMS49940_19520 [Spirochaetia bacterium]|nr:hypothetical protein AGMMS49940_19520 [Spirochaetia bacterium]